jgi:outer membrane protein assembly factor BamE (lipoprotein component of BamABCDE complex)
MFKIIFLVSAIGFLSSCATAGKMNNLSLGMTKEEVRKTMGNPASTKAADSNEVFVYRLSETSDEAFWGIESEFWCVFTEGKLSSYGRPGDFGTTGIPTQKLIIESQ